MIDKIKSFFNSASPIEEEVMQPVEDVTKIKMEKGKKIKYVVVEDFIDEKGYRIIREIGEEVL